MKQDILKVREERRDKKIEVHRELQEIIKVRKRNEI